MARYIDTEKVHIPKGFFEDLNVPKLLNWLKSQPTEDVVEVKHGKWIKSIHKEAPIIKDGRLFEKAHEVFCCSVCDVKIVGLRDMSFCPFCGAKMDGERRETDAE